MELTALIAKVVGPVLLLRGLGGDATRLLYTLGWHEVPLPPPGEDGAGANATWLIAGFDELAAKVRPANRVAAG